MSTNSGGWGRAMVDAIGSPERNGVRPGIVPSEEDLYWPAAMREVQTGLLRSVQIAAALIIAWALVGWTVVLTGLIMRVGAFAALNGLGIAMWLLPLVWWSLSGIWALRVYTVRRYRYFSNSPDSTRKAIERIGRRKAEHLYWAAGFWAAGVLATLCALVYSLSGTN